MQRSQSILLGLFISVWGGFAQAPAPLAFEVATIKPSGPPTEAALALSVQGLRITPPSVRATYTTQFALIRAAYNVRPNQIEAIPEWMQVNAAIFDVEAKMPEGATPEQVPLMLQKLLADRFRLAIHRKTTEQDLYVLEVAPGGPKFTKLDGQTPRIDPTEVKVGAEVTQRNGTRITRKEGYRLVETEKISGLVEFLRPTFGTVIDKTGLDESYAISMQVMNLAPPLAVAGQPAVSGSVADLMFPAVERLGLKLVRRKSPVEVIVIDRVEQLPSEN